MYSSECQLPRLSPGLFCEQRKLRLSKFLISSRRECDSFLTHLTEWSFKSKNRSFYSSLKTISFAIRKIQLLLPSCLIRPLFSHLICITASFVLFFFFYSPLSISFFFPIWLGIGWVWGCFASVLKLSTAQSLGDQSLGPRLNSGPHMDKAHALMGYLSHLVFVC